MSDTAVSLLTAPGTGAIATLQVRGPRVWGLARTLFAPAGKPLPDTPELNRFLFGTLSSDEVVLAVTAADAIEVHCHGGPRVVRLVIDQFLTNGCAEDRTPRPSGEGFDLLQRAPTLRTASIILDQLNGAFANEVRRIIAMLETDPPSALEPLQQLASLGETAGRHLVEPWKVVVAGPPNVGKSSLVNALAGYQRAVVSEVAGTTRDTVSVSTAFDGWPVELIDTAGLRDADGLEGEGIERAKQVLEVADLVLWVMDGCAPNPVWPTDAETPDRHYLSVSNKADLPQGWDATAFSSEWGIVQVSALTGRGITELVDEILRMLAIEFALLPGTAVPFNLQLGELVRAASDALRQHRRDEAAKFLQESLALAEAHTAVPLSAGVSS